MHKITGKDTSLDTDECSVTHAVVFKLLEGLENRGHHVYMDNYKSLSKPATTGIWGMWYSPYQQTWCARWNQGEAAEGRDSVKDDRRQCEWMDKRPVAMFTTVHDDSVVTCSVVEEVRKPVVVECYNEFMGGGVDTGDQLLSYYGFSHSTLKWWRRAFFHLIELAIVTVYIMYLTTPCEGRRLQSLEHKPKSQVCWHNSHTAHTLTTIQ